MATKTIVILPEDIGHSLFLKPLIERMAREMLRDLSWSVEVLNPACGVGRLKQTLRRLLFDYSHASNFPDLFIVGIDGNCKGAKARRKEIEGILNGTAGLGDYVLAVPNAHIEQWMMADSEAFRNAIGKGHRNLPMKCDRDYYKQQFAQALAEAGIQPFFQGFEYSTKLIESMGIEYCQHESLRYVIEDVRKVFRRWVAQG